MKYNKVLLLLSITVLGGSVRANDYFYHHPYLLIPTVAATVGLSKLCYNLADKANFNPLGFLEKSKQTPQSKKRAVSVGLLKVSGEIYDAKPYLEYFEQVKTDPSIYGLLLIMDSPGGSGSASYHLYYELKKVAEKKPVLVFTDNLCCSGGYLISCAASWIITTDLTLVGSVGAVQEFIHFVDDIKGSIGTDKGKIKRTLIKGGKYKTAGNAYEALTPDYVSYLQERCDQSYKVFYTLVAKERNLDIEKKDEWAEGQVFLGMDALTLGLVDQLGGWSDARAKIKELVFTKHNFLDRRIELIDLEKQKKKLKKSGIEPDQDNDADSIISYAGQLSEVQPTF